MLLMTQVNELPLPPQPFRLIPSLHGCKKVLKIASICMQKHLAPLFDSCCYCTHVFVQHCRIDIFNRCLEVINEQGLDSSNLEFDPDPQEKVAEVAIRGMQRPKDLQQSQNDSFSFE